MNNKCTKYQASTALYLIKTILADKCLVYKWTYSETRVTELLRCCRTQSKLRLDCVPMATVTVTFQQTIGILSGTRDTQTLSYLHE